MHKKVNVPDIWLDSTDKLMTMDKGLTTVVTIPALH